MVTLFICSVLSGTESSAYLEVSHEHLNSLASAVDAKGLLHRGKDYHSQILPWIGDRTNTVAPVYPLADRGARHQGTGVIHLTLNLKTGAVVNASVENTTGFNTLDTAAISAFRQWRWRPGRWKEIYLPVTFQLRDPLDPVPKEGAPLPQPKNKSY